MSDSDSALASLHAVVHGHVQEVFFRAFVQQYANSLRLTGYVRNVRQTGAVEVEAEGKRSGLEKLLELLHQGPEGAVVDRVELRWGEYGGEFSGFSIRH